MINLKEMAEAAKNASYATATTAQKNKALEILAEHLLTEKEKILEANQKDILLANGLLKDRLALKIEGLVHDIHQIIALPDPVGEVFEQQILVNGLKLSKCRIPLGVLGVIYESRPNVTIDISALAIKSGNAVLLRGGSETINTNRVLADLIQKSLIEAGLPKEKVQFIDSPDRNLVKEMLQLYEYIDLIIPRGSAALQQYCREHSKIPVITGGVGICHLFVDESADLKQSLEVIINAKTQRPSVCNALDTLLVHEKINFVPQVMDALKNYGVSFNFETWDKEWLSLVLSIKVVTGLEEAIVHIQRYSTGHSDGILTENPANAELFTRRVNSAAVYVNASTRFTDGGQFGLGSEVAVSTQKLHARGPMGLKELTTYKWIVRGNYHVRK